MALQSQTLAFKSHLELAFRLSQSYSTSMAIHTYDQGELCREALIRAISKGRSTHVTSSTNKRHARMLVRLEGSSFRLQVDAFWHSDKVVRGQGALWRAAFATSTRNVDQDVVVVVRADLQLQHGYTLARQLLAAWGKDERRAVFAYPFACRFHEHGRPSMTAAWQSLSLQPYEQGSAHLEPFMRWFVCTEFAKLFSPTPSVSDQLHLIPRQLIPLARDYFFGHDMTQCLREHKMRFSFVDARPYDTDSSICANPLYHISGRAVAPLVCAMQKDALETFERYCGAHLNVDAACAVEPIGSKRCMLEMTGEQAHVIHNASSQGCRAKTLDARIGW